MKKIVLVLTVFGLLTVFVASATTFWLRTSLPITNGLITLDGLAAPVTVTRDVYGIPHIKGESQTDVYFGLGFVHAQDRMWQMETARRAGAGRLSEIFGKTTLNADKYLRGLGFYHAAKASLHHYEKASRALIEAYATGINAYLASHKGPLPLEFLVFRHQPELWTAADSVVSAKMMSQKLGANADAELMRHQLAQQLTPSQLSELWPSYPGNPPRPLEEVKALPGAPALIEAVLAALPPTATGKVGSNNWVVDGRHTQTGKPLLANDPHLGLSAPSPWYIAHLSAPNLNVAGATLPGIPIIIVGRNEALAWGITNTGPDVQDFFVEKTVENDPTRYMTPHGTAAFHKRTETIRVKDSPNVSMEIRETRHGPVISDASAPHANAISNDEALALAWTALSHNDTTLQAGFRLANAKSWPEMQVALRDFIAPQQNFVSAHIDGGINFIAAGRVPIRRNGDGWLPSAGWTGDGDWIGTIPFDELPRQHNADDGMIVTANQKIVAEDYPHFITHEWSMPYRAQRIKALLADPSNHTIAGFKMMQTDVQSIMARDFLPLMLAVTPDVKAREIHNRLTRWDGSMDKVSIEPLIFHTWYRELTRFLYADELGDKFGTVWDRRPNFMYRTLTGENEWCDNVTTAPIESCSEQILAAQNAALLWLNERYGDNSKSWKWGAAHRARHRHQAFSKIPVLGNLFDIVHSHSGGPFTVMQANTTIANIETPFEENHGAALRMIFDLADLDGTHVMISTGQSGNIFSRHYNDLVDHWSNGKWILLPMTTEAVEVAAKNHLVLMPSNP